MFSKKENLTFIEFFFIVLFVLFFSLLMLWSADKVFGAEVEIYNTLGSPKDAVNDGGVGIYGYFNSTSSVYLTKVRAYKLPSEDARPSDYITLRSLDGGTIYATSTSRTFVLGDIQDHNYIEWGFSTNPIISAGTFYSLYSSSFGRDVYQLDPYGFRGVVDYRIYGTVFGNSGAPPFSGTIDLVYPTSTTNQDFTDFKINYTLGTTTDEARTFYVDWGTSTSTWTHTDYVNEIPIPPTNSETGIDIPKSSTVPIGQTYYAQARLEMGGVNIATSSIISWTPTSSWIYENFYEDLPTSTASSTDWVITCDPDSNVFVNSLCKIAIYLFVPNNNALDKFTNLKDAIISKPPVGYFYSIKTAISSIATSTAPISISFGDTSATSSPFYIFKTGMNWVLWFIFGFWVLNRFRHFDL